MSLPTDNNDNNNNNNNNSVPLPPDVQTKLQTLNQHQKQWRTQVTVNEKLALLEEMDRILCQEMTLEKDWYPMSQWMAETMMGFNTNTPEGKFTQSFEAVIPLLQLKGILDRLIEAYRVACGVSTNMNIYNKKLHPATSSNTTSTTGATVVKKCNGQFAMNVFPLTTKDSFGASAGLNVEWWFDSTHVQNVKDIPKPFDLVAFEDDIQDQVDDDGGVLVVLGAGNQIFLTMVDLIEGLFVRQRVVLVKHHPIRGIGLDPFLRKLLRPLYEQGVLESILDLEEDESSSIPQKEGGGAGGGGANSALVYHPLVTAIHMTGGKHTHDTIVWGETEEEQERRKLMKQPKLDNAEMTSELGCITPWIMVPAKYSQKELKHHAEILFAGLHGNASANCLSPKVIIMDEHWSQRGEFLEILQQTWAAMDLPVAYYPGSQQRWEAYQQKYPSAKLWHSKTSRSVKERQLSPPLMNAKKGDTEACVLPLLCLDLTVDLSSNDGRMEAKNQYAFQQEPFCPVVTFVTIKSDGSLKNYMESTVTLCNDHIFGSLSCSVSLPPSLDKDPNVETAIANLLYGTIAINLWSGQAYPFSWGGHAANESLDKVESGLGRVGNYLFLQHLQKSVVKAPFVWSQHIKVNPDYDQTRKELEAVAAFIISPSFTTFVSLISAVLKLPIPSMIFGTTAAAVAVVAWTMWRRR